jgi:hypothetical protein
MAAALLLPEWLIGEHYVTLATWGLVLVTFLLVIATFVMWLDSLSKGREQKVRWVLEDEQHRKDREEERSRWRRDDEIRQEEQRPKFDFGLDIQPLLNSHRNDVVVWCANLGSASFIVKRILARHLIDFDEDEAPKHFDPQVIVKAGEMARVSIPASLFMDVHMRADKEFWIAVSSADIEVESAGKIFSFFAADRSKIDNISEGFHGLKKVKCVKCDATGFLPPNGVLSKTLLAEMMNRAATELAETCPSHESGLLKSVIDVNGIRRSLNQNA